MYGYDNYPPGAANDPNAPWNEYEPSDKDFDVWVIPHIQKEVTISTNEYEEYLEEEEDGYYHEIDTSETDWDKCYHNEEFDILQMLNKLKEYVEKDIEQLKAQGKRIPYELKTLLKSCQGWEEEDSTEYELD